MGSSVEDIFKNLETSSFSVTWNNISKSSAPGVRPRAPEPAIMVPPGSSGLEGLLRLSGRGCGVSSPPIQPQRLPLLPCALLKPPARRCFRFKKHFGLPDNVRETRVGLCVPNARPGWAVFWSRGRAWVLYVVKSVRRGVTEELEHLLGERRSCCGRSSCSRRVLGYVIICLSYPTRIGLHGTLVIRLLLTLVIMLAEGILTRLVYKESCHQDKPRKSPASKKDKEGIWRQKLVDNPKIKGFADGHEKQDEISARSSKMERGSGPQWRSIKEVPAEDQKMLVKGTVSPALRIPKREQNTEQMDLYRSCSCSSIYQNYPDLHIGGDRVGDHMCDSGCVLDHVCDELSDGPVLLSIDIPLGQFPLCEHPEKPSIKSLSGDEAGEKSSIMLCAEPLSNSMLNKYMETKVAEFYKQFFEENLTRCGSVTNLLTCSLIRNNLNQISFQVSQEQNIETSKAREVLLHSLALFSLHNTTNRNSSEFSTPNLQISNPACVKKSCRMQFTL